MGKGEGRDHGVAGAAPLAAALGCLQPGIDPVFLTLVSQASTVPPSAHGLIVMGTQTGAAIGALAVWRLGGMLPHTAVIAASFAALVLSLATAVVDDIAALLAIRCGFGATMGVVYAYAMGAHAARRPNRAFGAVFLIQLLLSTLVAVAAPELARTIGATGALVALALAPAIACLALTIMPAPATVRAAQAVMPAPVPAAGWALAAATFWFICATMLVWSFCAALAAAAGIGDRTIGHAVALGSVAGAVTAAAVMRERLALPLPLTALLAAMALASPVVLTTPGAEPAFVVSVILLNVGSTAIIIRCSGLAAASSTDPRFRTFVACTHSVGLIAGPALGTMMVAFFGFSGLVAGTAAALVAGIGAVTWTWLSRGQAMTEKTVLRLDRTLTLVQFADGQTGARQ